MFKNSILYSRKKNISKITEKSEKKRRKDLEISMNTYIFAALNFILMFLNL
jgi:hypothetical protein